MSGALYLQAAVIDFWPQGNRESLNGTAKHGPDINIIILYHLTHTSRAAGHGHAGFRAISVSFFGT